MGEQQQRKHHILTLVIENFIQTGEPVGSVTVVQRLPQAVSSATVRNDMAALERNGLLVQPHTSAGRVPTYLGYRYYLDHLMKPGRLTNAQQEEVHNSFSGRATDPESLVEQYAAYIAEFTHLAAVATMPAPKRAVIRQIQVIQTGQRSVFVALVSNFGTVKTTAFRTDISLESEDIVVLNNFLNTHLCGIPLEELTPGGVQTVVTRLGDYALTLSPLVIGIYQLAKSITLPKLFVAGKSNLLHYHGADITALQQLRLLEDEDTLWQLIRDAGNSPEVLFGDEIGLRELHGSSLIRVSYKVGDQPAGSLALIGPERMRYPVLLPYVQYFAHHLGQMLTEFYQA